MVEQRSPKPSIWVRILVLLPETLKDFPKGKSSFRNGALISRISTCGHVSLNIV